MLSSQALLVLLSPLQFMTAITCPFYPSFQLSSPLPFAHAVQYSFTNACSVLPSDSPDLPPSLWFLPLTFSTLFTSCCILRHSFFASIASWSDLPQCNFSGLNKKCKQKGTRHGSGRSCRLREHPLRKAPKG